MPKGIMWRTKCECGHSQARHKKSFDRHHNGTEYISDFGYCRCKNCKCEKFAEVLESEQ